jgi:hypothetical protein
VRRKALKLNHLEEEASFGSPASIERSPMEVVQRQSELFLGSHDRAFLDILPTPFMALNADRQIVFGNQALSRYLGGMEPESMLSMRPGEVLHCVYSHGEHGCGTSEHCRECGTLQAIIGSQAGQPMEMDCQVLYRARSVDAKDLRMHTYPRTVGEEAFTLVFMEDIGADKRRENLERIFYHDALNAAGGIYNAAMLLETLQMAESGTLEVCTIPVSSREIVESLISSMGGLARKVGVGLSRGEVEPMELVTDRDLLFRVMENYAKNAIEAAKGAGGEGGVVVSMTREGALARYAVSNPGYIPRDVQHQIFKRSFSTKGRGRGLGTFSAKLFTENYLGGSVGFESTKEGGTTFWALLPVHLETGSPLAGTA